MRAKDVKSKIGNHNLFGALSSGHSGSPKMVKTATWQVSEEISIDQARANVASNLWHVTFG